ncbi:MAG: sigma-70 family RNA polymerase sigma factor [Xenococcus sp. (in: cyanobacteria)]
MNILRYEENDIEFFTVQATGESGISYSGLAILCGVNQSTITRLISKLRDITPLRTNRETQLKSTSSNGFNPMRDKILKRLEAFIGKELHLEGDYKKQGGEVKILRADFCAAVIKHYALEGREIAEHSMDKFMTLGINTWIQSITGWQTTQIPLSQPPISQNSEPTNIATNPNIDQLLEQIEIVRHNLLVSLKHRHAIHNIVEKPTVVDLSLNQIIHTAVHLQSEKLNQALATLQLVREQALTLKTLNHQIQQSQQLWESVDQLTNTVEQIRQQKNQQQQEITNLKNIIQQQTALLQSRRQPAPKYQLATTELRNLGHTLAPRIQEITTILMKSQKRQGGTRAISTCTKRAEIYARYEIGQSLEEIAQALKMPYQTVKSYVKLTRKELKNNS